MVPATEGGVTMDSRIEVHCLTTGLHQSSLTVTFINMPTSASAPRSPVTYSLRGEPGMTLTTCVSKTNLPNGKTLHPSRTLTNNSSRFASTKLKTQSVCKSKGSVTLSQKENCPVSDNSNKSNTWKANSHNINDCKTVSCHTNSLNANKSKVIANKTSEDVELSYYQEQGVSRSINNINTTNQLSYKKDVVNQITNKQHSCCTQLLHPDWRRVPWKPQFGWTAAHQQLYNQLKAKVKNGELVNIYYDVEEDDDHAACHIPQLSGPSVTSVSEVLEVIGNMNHTKSRLRLLLSRTLSIKDLDQYDADDEEYL